VSLIRHGNNRVLDLALNGYRVKLLFDLISAIVMVHHSNNKDVLSVLMMVNGINARVDSHHSELHAVSGCSLLSHWAWSSYSARNKFEL